MPEHARLSPSAAHRWMLCPGSVAMEESRTQGFFDSIHSKEGTAAHELAQWVLNDGAKSCALFIGRKTTNGWVVTADMARDTQVYVDAIREYATGHTLLVEQRVDFSGVVEVPDSFGTADAIILTNDSEELQIHDLKFGRGVQVFAEENEQLMIYALGAMQAFSLTHDFKRIRLVIHQPRLQHLSEWDCTMEDLVTFSAKLKRQAKKAIIYADIPPAERKVDLLNPGEKQCRWCKALSVCPAAARKVTDTVGAEFEDLTANKIEVPHDPEELAQKMNATNFIEGWLKAVRGEVERVLFNGEKVPGYKLVQGKQGNRAWTNEDEVEALFKEWRLKQEQIYDFKLISPTNAEKLFSTMPRRWKKIEPLITRSPGTPSVAPESDKRPPLSIQPDFHDVREEAQSLI